MHDSPLYTLKYNGKNSSIFKHVCPEFYEEWLDLDFYKGAALILRDLIVFPDNYVIFTPHEIIICEAKGGAYDWIKK